MKSEYVWTTADELNFVRHSLYDKGRVSALRNYIHCAQNRTWHGYGMKVDPQLVIFTAMDLLKEMETMHVFD